MPCCKRGHRPGTGTSSVRGKSMRPVDTAIDLFIAFASMKM